MSAEIIDLSAERQKRRDDLAGRLLHGILPDLQDRQSRGLTAREAQIVATLRDCLSRATPWKGGAP